MVNELIAIRQKLDNAKREIPKKNPIFVRLKFSLIGFTNVRWKKSLLKRAVLLALLFLLPGLFLFIFLLFVDMNTIENKKSIMKPPPCLIRWWRSLLVVLDRLAHSRNDECYSKNPHICIDIFSMQNARIYSPT